MKHLATRLNDWLSVPARQSLMTRMAVIYGLLFIASVFLVSVITPGILIGDGGMVGGDYLAFYTASDLTLQGRAVEAYDFAVFDAALQTHAPSENLGLMWQYPPVMFLIAAPLALMPYKVSYWLWMTLTAALYAGALRRILKDVVPDPAHQWRAFALLMSAPICVSVIVNGQISLMTAAFLMLAAYRPRANWLVAGIAAGLLTIKPQLGLLLPIAFLLAGAWRAFAVAAVTTIVIHAVSILVFGPESLAGFFAAVSRLQADVAGAGLHTPPVSMTTLFGQLRLWGVPGEAALAAQYAFALMVFAFVTWVWWRSARDPAHGLYLAALLCAGAILVTPYAYAYEMAVFAPAALWLAFQSDKYRSLAAAILVAFWLAFALRRFVPPEFIVQIPFIAALAVFALLVFARPFRQKPERLKRPNCEQ